MHWIIFSLIWIHFKDFSITRVTDVIYHFSSVLFHMSTPLSIYVYIYTYTYTYTGQVNVRCRSKSNCRRECRRYTSTNLSVKHCGDMVNPYMNHSIFSLWNPACHRYNLPPWHCINKKTIFPGMGIPMLKIRWSRWVKATGNTTTRLRVITEYYHGERLRFISRSNISKL